MHLPFNFGLGVLPEWERAVGCLIEVYEAALPEGEILCSTLLNRTGSEGPKSLELGSYEGLVVSLA